MTREEPETIRRKRLAYQCAHRGMKEMDLILGAFARDCLPGLLASELDDLERVLAIADDLLFSWISGRAPVPPGQSSPILEQIVAGARG